MKAKPGRYLKWMPSPDRRPDSFLLFKILTDTKAVVEYASYQSSFRVGDVAPINFFIRDLGAQILLKEEADIYRMAG